MVQFVIIEADDGLTVVELDDGQTAEDAAAVHGGVLVDPGPYPSYEEACDALVDIPDNDEEE